MRIGYKFSLSLRFIIDHLGKIPLVNYQIRIIKRKWKYKLDISNSIKNIQKQLDKLEFNIEFNKRKIPKRVAIEITNTCNLNCLMCNTKLSKRAIGYIEPNLFDSILKKLNIIGIKEIALHTVGEPFMYKNLDKLFQIINKHQFKVSLSTNGQFPSRLQKIIHSHFNSIKSIRFSIDGAKRETYEKIRLGAKFERLIKSLEIVHIFNHNKKNFKIPVKIDSIVSLTNIDEISLFFKIFGKFCWPESINFNLINGLSPEKKYFLDTFPFPNLITRMVPCNMPFNNIYFTYDGQVTLCCRDYNGELIVGDSNKDSLIKIWNGKISEDIRSQHLNSEKLKINACKNCFGPYSFLISITNEYIHFLHYHQKKLSPHEFGEKILILLKDLNKAMENKNKNIVKSQILKHFREIMK